MVASGLAFQKVAEEGIECNQSQLCLGSAHDTADSEYAEARKRVHAKPCKSMDQSRPSTHVYAHGLGIDPVLIGVVLRHVDLALLDFGSALSWALLHSALRTLQSF